MVIGFWFFLLCGYLYDDCLCNFYKIFLYIFLFEKKGNLLFLKKKWVKGMCVVLMV